MKWTSRIQALLALAALAAAALAPTSRGGPVSDAEISRWRESLPPHPRIIIDPDAISRIEGNIKSDAVAAAMWDAVESHAASIVTQPVMPEPTPGPSGILVMVREEVDRIYSLCLAARLTGNTTYEERALAEMLNMASWSTWNPPHFLDVAEAMHGVSVGYDCFYQSMNDTTRTTIADAIATKGLAQFSQGVSEGQWWYSTIWNWGGVCNGGAIVAGLTLLDDPTHGEAAQLALNQSLANDGIFQSLSSYAPDGAWPEGPTYADYMGRLLIDANTALMTATGQDDAISSTPGLDQACEFILYSASQGVDRMFNWADAESESGPHANLFAFSTMYNIPACAYYARVQATFSASMVSHLRSRPSLLLHAQSHDLAHVDLIEAAANTSLPAAGADATGYSSSVNILSRQLIYYTSMGTAEDLAALPRFRVYEDRHVMTVRNSWNMSDYAHMADAFLGFKGGNNTWNHGHLDMGSFVYDFSAGPLAVDLGAGSYALPDYFGDKRWTYYRCNNSGHNTLMFDNGNQNTKAGAPFTNWGSGPDGGWAIANLTDAYSPAAHSALRGAILGMNNSMLFVRDEIEAGMARDNVTWRMHTQFSVNVSSPTVASLTFPIGSRTVTAYVYTLPSTSCPHGAFSTHPVVLAPPQEPAPGVNVLDFVSPSPSTCTTISMAIGWVPPGVYAVDIHPLAQWSNTTWPIFHS